MSHHTKTSCCALLLLVILEGCALERSHRPVSLGPRDRLVERSVADANDPSKPGGLVQPVGATREGPRHALVLSGGGANGAYTAGVLNGWTASGTRPEFDVVTGISTGALIAPFAFLGSEFDDTLRRGYTHCEESDIYTRRWLFTLLWADAIADSKPLKNKIASEVTPQVLEKVAEAHRSGRRLYVGTTDLDSKKLVVWDMGAIAASTNPNRLHLFRNVLLASASVPGLFPPVELVIDVDGRRHTELHVDGGVAAALFLQPSMLGVDPDDPHHVPRDNLHVHVIVAGQLQMPRRTVRRRLTTVVEESIGGVLQSQLEGDLLKTYLLTKYSGGDFSLAAIPRDLTLDSHKGATGPLAFETGYMTRVFNAGYAKAESRQVWQHVPSGFVLADQSPPRSSTEFTVREAIDTEQDLSGFSLESKDESNGPSFVTTRLLNRLRGEGTN